MQYLLMLYIDEAKRSTLNKTEGEQVSAAYNAFTEALRKADALRGTNRLQASSSATTVRVKDGKTQVLDGPYPDSKEQLGGYYLIEAPDLDAALTWAARCPTASHGTVEVRPIWAMTSP